MEYFWPFSWILIPLAGILAGTFKEWLKFKEKQNQLGNSTANLEDNVAELTKSLEKSEQNRKVLIERIQNLETIVTSQNWDLLDPQSAINTPTSRILEERDLIDVPEAEPTTREKTARLARRLNS